MILKNKKFIISAAGDGIGFSISKLIVENGGKVYLTDIDHQKINKIKRNNKFKNKIFANQLDANNYEEVREYFLSLSHLKKIDGLINNVGIAGPTKYVEKITSEVCIHHLSFNDKDYEKKKGFIKWNPSVKTSEDQKQLWESLLEDRIDVIATDHAPHTFDEKSNNYLSCPSGGPMVQHSLSVMFEHFLNNKISLEQIVQKMCHNPAIIFKVKNRGYIRENYYADLVVVDPKKSYTVNQDNILYKCGWSPFEGTKFNSQVIYTFVNGKLVFDNGKINETIRGKKISFE